MDHGNNRRLVLAWVITPVVLVYVGFVGQKCWWELCGARIEAPERIDLGIREVARTIRVPIPIKNVGHTTLELSEFATSCGACVGLLPKGTLRVEPGKVSELVVEATVAGRPGDSLRRYVQFRTNDVRQPVFRVYLDMGVEGGVTCHPTTLDFGAIIDDRQVEGKLEIRDTGSRRVHRVRLVESSRPDQIRVSGIELCNKVVDERNPALGRTIAIVSVTAHAGSKPDELRGDLRIVLDTDQGEETLVVRAFGRRVPLITLSPATIVLPVASNGQWRYSVKCLVRSNNGQPFAIRPSAVPDGVRIGGLENGNDRRTTFVLEVELLMPQTSNQARLSTIGLEAEFRNRTVPLELLLKVNDAAME